MGALGRIVPSPPCVYEAARSAAAHYDVGVLQPTCHGGARRALGWPTCMAHILLSRINATERTRADKLYYDKCLAVQKGHRLPDDCPSDAFSKRAVAFVLHLMPNLAQTYTQEDAADYIVVTIETLSGPPSVWRMKRPFCGFKFPLFAARNMVISRFIKPKLAPVRCSLERK